MCLNLKYKFYIVLLIVLFQCVTIYTADLSDLSDFDFDDDFKESEPDYCFLPLPHADTYNMPIIYSPVISGPQVLVPDKLGHVSIGRFDRFQLSCAGGKFVSPTKVKGKTELTLECARGDIFIYGNRQYSFDQFRCNQVPKARLVVTNETCGGVKNGLYFVGYPTEVNLTVYKVCYDPLIKRTLYSWHYVHAPVYKHIQTSKSTPLFVTTELFKDINMKHLYENQDKTMENITKGRLFDVNEYYNKATGRFLRPSLLTSANEYFFNFQQHATYFYENTAPLWSVFSRGIWKEIEKLFMRNLAKLVGEHLIVSGTFNTSSIRLGYDIYKPLILYLPDKVPAPQYVWKMLYNVNNRKGIVFIGLNTPDKVDSTKRFCPEIPCPGKLSRKYASIKVSTFCCTLETFEKVHGAIDPCVYHTF